MVAFWPSHKHTNKLAKLWDMAQLERNVYYFKLWLGQKKDENVSWTNASRRQCNMMKVK